MDRCKNCKFWGRDTVGLMERWGVCTMVIRDGSLVKTVSGVYFPRGQMADDAVVAWARLETHEEFGCVYHREES